jgi:luciferase family oxidoreductase group 1
MPFALSILDQSTVVSGRAPADAIRETLELARLADRLGYARYWLAEHHNSASHAGSAPEVLMAAIAATTQRIRLGSAGIMLPHYAALKVAEQFRVLEAIAPGRIDLGVGRAPGSDGRTAYALNPAAYQQTTDQFPRQVQDLLGWLGEGLPVDHPFQAVQAQPSGHTVPQVWMLGSSDYGARLAAALGLPYCFAAFITDGSGTMEALETYRRQFRALQGRLPAPYAAIAVFALCADTEAEAHRLYRSREIWKLSRDHGAYAPLPSVAEAEAWPLSDVERARLDQLRSRALVGTPEQLRERLRALADEAGAQEIAVLCPMHDDAARRRSITLLAEAFDLAAAPVS